MQITHQIVPQSGQRKMRRAKIKLLVPGSRVWALTKAKGTLLQIKVPLNLQIQVVNSEILSVLSVWGLGILLHNVQTKELCC